MDRLKVNDLIIGAYINSLKSQGYKELAERIKGSYEGRRAEIIANSKKEVSDGLER